MLPSPKETKKGGEGEGEGEGRRKKKGFALTQELHKLVEKNASYKVYVTNSYNIQWSPFPSSNTAKPQIKSQSGPPNTKLRKTSKTASEEKCGSFFS